MITIRASALSDFFDCPARAEAKHLLHKRTPSSGRSVLGTDDRRDRRAGS